MNPLTYQVDALRRLMIEHAPSVFGLGTDFLVQLAALTVLTLIATWLYPRIVN